MERSFVAIRYSPLPQPCPVIPFMNIFILEEELSFVSVPLFNVKYPTCDGYKLKCLAYIYLFSVEPHPFFLQHCTSALQLFPLAALAILMCPPTAVVSFLSLSFPMSCRVCCSQGWEQGQVISRANRSHLVCRLQLMGTEAVSDELLVPHSWEILENEQGITLIDSYLWERASVGGIWVWYSQKWPMFCHFLEIFPKIYWSGLGDRALGWGACTNAWQWVWCSKSVQPLLLWLPGSLSKSWDPQVAVWLPAAPRSLPRLYEFSWLVAQQNFFWILLESWA